MEQVGGSCRQQVGIRNGTTTGEQSGRNVLGRTSALQTDVSTFMWFLWTTTALAVLFSLQLLYYCNLVGRQFSLTLEDKQRGQERHQCVAVVNHRDVRCGFVVFLSPALGWASCECWAYLRKVTSFHLNVASCFMPWGREAWASQRSSLGLEAQSHHYSNHIWKNCGSFKRRGENEWKRNLDLLSQAFSRNQRLAF